MTVFHSFTFKIGLILAVPHHLPLVFGWVIEGYLRSSLVIPHHLPLVFGWIIEGYLRSSLVIPHHLPLIFGWVIEGYLRSSLVIPHLILNTSFVSFYCLGFMCVVPRRDYTKAIFPSPLLSVVMCFAVFIWCLRVLISYFWVPMCCFHVWLRVFLVFILKYFWFISKHDLKWYFIICSNQKLN